MSIQDKLVNCSGFEWDEGNFDKNFILHAVTTMECEEVFFNHPLMIKKDEKHSQNEERYYCLGHADSGRLLFIAFMIRGWNIRVVSARAMTRKEERIYMSL